jgi:hypothetical protein
VAIPDFYGRDPVDGLPLLRRCRDLLYQLDPSLYCALSVSELEIFWRDPVVGLDLPLRRKHWLQLVSEPGDFFKLVLILFPCLF